ncbi:MAG: hypothetical protein P1V51_20825 [Deltaproteobacteria bacterium]|nr:hypothetical protein [Deltaproteobacteria bacterium]
MSLDFPTALSSPSPAAPSAALPGSTFRGRISRGLDVASQVAGAAGALVPGAGLISLALGGMSRLLGARGAGTAGAAGGLAAESPGLESLLSGSRGLNLRYLALQESMAREARAYTALSNIMRARHEAAQNAIANIR